MPDNPDVDPRDLMFPALVERVFLDSQTSRLSRALENSPRNVQKWLNAENDAPPHARDFINEQLQALGRLKAHPYLEIQIIMRDALDAGVHPEAVASILSKLYEELTGKTIR